MIDRREGSIRTQIENLFDVTEQAVEKALASVAALDKAAAQSVIDGDSKINEIHRKIEEDCVTLIARMQPMARDLRELVSDIQVAGELERIGDYASSIANTVLLVKSNAIDEVSEAIGMLGKSCLHMLREVRDAYKILDGDQARDAAARDDVIDRGEKEIIDMVFERQLKSPENFEFLTYALWITHSLERIGDRVVNIAERIVYVSSSRNENLD
jgi:phosphate transport system protein